ncbi:MAG: hypothetical protein RR500_09720, partial [Bacilli bacterium]
MKQGLESQVVNFTVQHKSIEIGSNIYGKVADDILGASKTGLINHGIDSNLALRPQLLINDHNKGNKVLSDIVKELSKCNEFIMSVAFITT